MFYFYLLGIYGPPKLWIFPSRKFKRRFAAALKLQRDFVIVKLTKTKIHTVCIWYNFVRLIFQSRAQGAYFVWFAAPECWFWQALTAEGQPFTCRFGNYPD